MVQRKLAASIINSYVRILQQCIRMKALEQGRRVHADIIRTGFESNIFLGNTLLDMYAKCGRAEDARRTFDKMREHNVFSWTAIISAHVKQGQGEEAVNLFQQMQSAGVVPDKYVFAVVLKACTGPAALEKGKRLHADIVKNGFELDVFVGNTLIDMYAKCGSIEDAHNVFNKMCQRDVVSWNTLISGYAQQGNGEEAFKLFVQMQQEGAKPDRVTFVSILRACGNHEALAAGKLIHECVIQRGFQLDAFVGSSLIHMYAKCGSIEDAREVFSKLHRRDVVLWTGMIECYVQQGYTDQAFALFQRMQKEGVQPNKVTFVSILKACAHTASLHQGKQVHALVIYRGFESDAFVGGSLVDMYAKCGSIQDAQRVFNKIHKPDAVSWTALIAGYVQKGCAQEAFTLFERMQQEGLKPDNVTYVSILKACSSLPTLEWGKQVHAQLIENGFESDVFIGNTLVDMYAKCGSIADAWQVFNNLPKRNVVSWTAMIGAYAQQQLGEEALTLFQQMQHEGINPDNVTLINILKSCTSLTTLERGKQVHAYIVKYGFDLNAFVGSTLVDMYIKCGSIEDACQVFHKMHERSTATWNAMIAGYAQQGYGNEVFRLFEYMQQQCIKPDKITFVCLLSACSHAGLVVEGHHNFDSMNGKYGIIPTGEHYACMIDLLCRAGCLDEAKNFINKMPTQPNAAIWMTFLGACRNHGNVELGRHAFDCICKVEPKCAGAYVLLSNICAAAGRWDEVADIRNIMRQQVQIS